MARWLAISPNARRSSAKPSSSAKSIWPAQEAISKGITTFQDAGEPAEVIDRFKRRAAAGTLPLRLWVMLREPNEAILRDIPKVKMLGFGDDHLTVRAIKRQIDGALGTRGAWLLAPYSDMPSTSGRVTEPLEDIEKTAQIAIANDMQLCVHAIGDRANREVLNLYECTFQAHPEKRDLRWRIEHAQHLDLADIPRFAKLGVIASMQTVHCTSDAPMVIPRLGEKRAAEGALRVAEPHEIRGARVERHGCSGGRRKPDRELLRRRHAQVEKWPDPFSRIRRCRVWKRSNPTPSKTHTAHSKRS